MLKSTGLVLSQWEGVSGTQPRKRKTLHPAPRTKAARATGRANPAQRLQRRAPLRRVRLLWDLRTLVPLPGRRLFPNSKNFECCLERLVHQGGRARAQSLDRQLATPVLVGHSREMVEIGLQAVEH